MIQRGTFTFQSGTIQAIPGRDGSLISLDFTFQSGTIQARRSGKGVCCHSFTFQSGTIQANLSQGFHREPFSFTFQSGTIQAAKFLKSISASLHLYIPIWYNSSPPNCGVLFPMFSTPVSVYHDHIVNKNPFPVPFPNHRKRIFIGVFNPCRPRCIFTLS